ncbi:hypothetical protein I5Q34_11555 [Streptomyces sp. AV19]|uniref:hypothetical protein n=1 Tax=Streptomyces sp. AV19 TaxID=2793068 RepID=UPI0018FE4389|nr:hypothetical protein [Streptomyces sp. AV19]MBH1934902.1 hypothetical protein [Streptomyces sp. AV19]MDG4537036.1 hypothetical protein [Streptomyces sp. AV19]
MSNAISPRPGDLPCLLCAAILVERAAAWRLRDFRATQRAINALAEHRRRDHPEPVR